MYTQSSWSLPGGYVELGEHPARTAIREIQEELGTTIKEVKLEAIYLRQLPNTEFIQVTLYSATVQDDIQINDGEVADYNWFTLDDLPELMVPGDKEAILDLYS